MPAHDETLRAAVGHAQNGRMDLALPLAQQVLSEDPANAEANRLAGMILFHSGRTEAGLAHVQTAIRTAPQRADLRFLLGSMLAWMRQLPAAAAALEQAIELDPRNAQARGLLATIFLELKLTDRAEDQYKAAIEIDPRYPEARTNYATILNSSGRTKEAIQILRDAARDHPLHPGVMINYAVASNYAQDVPAEEIKAAHTGYGRAVMAQPGQAQTAWPNARDPEKRLRIGIVSPDLWEHSVGYFVLAFLQNRDRAQVEYVLFPTAARTDALAEKIHRGADAVRNVATANDQQLIQALRADRLDILLELSGLTQGNRMAALRLRGAPVQATAIGYPNTTGVPTFDYRIVDSLTDPPGAADAQAVEKLVRIDPCFLCYTPPESAPEVEPSAGRAAGVVSFGSFNSLKKVTPRVVETWAKILHAVPGSRLVLKSAGLGGRAADVVSGMLKQNGIPEVRFELLDRVNAKRGHLALYNQIDIALDTFPYNGTTTTCEALWMGVPVVALEGSLHAGRVGRSLLSAMGMRDLVASTTDEYVSVAARLASDTARLDTLRQTLRMRMLASPLCDAPRYARRLEGAFRQMWRAYCAGPHP
jgi:predicted O-linked N-acetylglucosamine transferase (SPINDLY family)